MGFRHNSAFRHTTSSATSIKLQELIAVVSFIQHPSGPTNKKQESRSLKGYISTLMSLSFDIQISSRNNREMLSCLRLFFHWLEELEMGSWPVQVLHKGSHLLRAVRWKGEQKYDFQGTSPRLSLSDGESQKFSLK